MHGALLLGGALGEPTDRAVLVFQGPRGAAAAEAFAAADPYLRNGLVRSWRVRPWTTVVGPDAGRLFEAESAPKLAAADALPRLVAFLRGARYATVASAWPGPASPGSAFGRRG